MQIRSFTITTPAQPGAEYPYLIARVVTDEFVPFFAEVSFVRDRDGDPVPTDVLEVMPNKSRRAVPAVAVQPVARLAAQRLAEAEALSAQAYLDAQTHG